MQKRSMVIGAAILAVAAPGSAQALELDTVAIQSGKLVITGKTSKPAQEVEVVGTGDKVKSSSSRRFRCIWPRARCASASRRRTIRA